jgi:sugar lactone lactonase YvrE
MPQVVSVQPRRAIEGGRVTLIGSGFVSDSGSVAAVHVRDRPARVVLASAERLSFLVPSGIVEPGPAPIRIGGDDDLAFVDLAAEVATGLHQVDNPAVDAEDNLYLTYSGTRGQQVPVSIFRVGANGTRETYSAGIVNPTSMAFDGTGLLYVSSRFEGVVYRVNGDGTAEPFATDLGIACGLAFGADGTLYAGDRSGTVFAVDPEGQATPFATLPSSVAAFHLAMGSDGLYVTGPTLATNDVVYRISLDGTVEVFAEGFGRPQGIAVGPDRALYVVEALAGASALYRLPAAHAPRELVLAGPGLVGVAFDHAGGLIVCTNETAYRLPHAALP